MSEMSDFPTLRASTIVVRVRADMDFTARKNLSGTSMNDATMTTGFDPASTYELSAQMHFG